MRGRFKKWAPSYLENEAGFAIKTIEKEDSFWDSSICLEIGSGKGDFIIGMASKHPDIHYLGLERDVSVCGLMAKKIAATELSNVRISNSDFDFFEEELSKLSFDKIYLNFSDPWPKKRHEKRRLTTKGRIEKMASLLKEGGELLIKTDNDNLYEFTKEEMPTDIFENIYDSFDYQFDEENDCMSEYERNFRSQGKSVHRLVYRKK